MKDVASIKLYFTSPTGECSREMEEGFEELERTIDYHVKQLCEMFPGLVCERSDD